jgi:hypothetical protein
VSALTATLAPGRELTSLCLWRTGHLPGASGIVPTGATSVLGQERAGMWGAAVVWELFGAGCLLATHRSQSGHCPQQQGRQGASGVFTSLPVHWAGRTGQCACCCPEWDTPLL